MKFKDVTRAISAAYSAYNLYTTIKTKYDSRVLYSIQLHEHEYLFGQMSAWIQDNVESKSVEIRTFGEHMVSGVAVGDRGRFSRGGYDFKYSLNDKNEAGITSFGAIDIKKPVLTISCAKKEGLSVIKDLLAELNVRTERTEPTLLTLAQWGNEWSERPLRRRSMDSVFLAGDTKEEILSDLEKFYADEGKYDALGIPYHRGYLFYGAPGGGKTSMAKAIATKYNLALYYLSLSSVTSDKELVKVVSQLSTNSILLIEDIDVFDSVNRETATDKKLTLSGLLNTLDGVVSPHGLITIITTNNKDALDPALLRSGRIDKQIEFSITPAQVAQAFEYIYGEPLGFEPPVKNMADFIELAKQNFDSPELCRMELELVRT